jgi:hypothetical protein
VGNHLSQFAVQLQAKWMHPLLVDCQNVTITEKGGGQPNTYATYLPPPQEFCNAVKGTCWQEFRERHLLARIPFCSNCCTQNSVHLCLRTVLMDICCLTPIEHYWHSLTVRFFCYHRVWNPEFSFSSLLMCAIFSSLINQLVFSPWAGCGRNQSPVRRPVWLWHAALWTSS